MTANSRMFYFTSSVTIRYFSEVLLIWMMETLQKTQYVAWLTFVTVILLRDERDTSTKEIKGMKKGGKV
jgi:hypothetical protein